MYHATDVTRRATSATTPPEPQEPKIPEQRKPSPGSLLPTGWDHHPAVTA